jgi:hypothetical protein
VKLKIGLRGKNRASETAGDDHHQLRKQPDLDDLIKKQFPTQPVSEKRAEGVGAKHHNFAQILNEPNERPAECAKKSNKHRPKP